MHRLYMAVRNGESAKVLIFCVPEYGCTFGELASDVKNSISHRARAFTALGSALKQYAEEGE